MRENDEWENGKRGMGRGRNRSMRERDRNRIKLPSAFTDTTSN